MRPDLDLKLRASEIARRRTEEERAEAHLSLRATTRARRIQSAMREQLERKESHE